MNDLIKYVSRTISGRRITKVIKRNWWVKHEIYIENRMGTYFTLTTLLSGIEKSKRRIAADKQRELKRNYTNDKCV